MSLTLRERTLVRVRASTNNGLPRTGALRLTDKRSCLDSIVVSRRNGTHQFSNNESATGAYYYRTAYDGNAPYANATNLVVSVSVTPTQTKITLTMSNSTPAVNQSVTFNATPTPTGSTTFCSVIAAGA